MPPVYPIYIHTYMWFNYSVIHSQRRSASINFFPFFYLFFALFFFLFVNSLFSVQNEINKYLHTRTCTHTHTHIRILTGVGNQYSNDNRDCGLEYLHFTHIHTHINSRIYSQIAFIWLHRQPIVFVVVGVCILLVKNPNKPQTHYEFAVSLSTVEQSGNGKSGVAATGVEPQEWGASETERWNAYA